MKFKCKYRSELVEYCPRQGRCYYAEIELGECTYQRSDEEEELFE